MLINILINIHIGAVSVSIFKRCRGVFTGTQTASLLSRIPVQQIAKLRAPAWKQLGFSTNDEHAVSFMARADNLFSATYNMESAVCILEDAALWLKRVWNLDINGDSKQCLAAKGDTVIV